MQKTYLSLLKKSNILVKKGAVLLGTIDENQILEPDEIYV